MKALSRLLTRNSHLLALLGTLLLVGAVGLMSWIEVARSRETRLSIRHTNQVIATVDALGIALRDAETGQRGFLLTGSARYLAPFDEAFSRIARLNDRLVRLTADNPVQQAHLSALAPVLRQKLDELQRTVQQARDGQRDAAVALVRTDLGLQLMEQLRVALAGMTAEEERLLTEHRKQFDAKEARGWLLAAGATLLALVLYGASLWLLARARAALARSDAEQRLLAEQMRTAFESISQGIGVFRADGSLARWNGCFGVLLRIAPPVLRAGTPYEALAAAAGTAADGPLLEPWEQVRRDGAAGVPVIYDRTRRADGRSFELRRTAMPDGGFVLTVTDITERVGAERTARDAQRMQAIGQLTGGIAHDFNNLLTVVLGNLERLALRLGGDHEGRPQIERAIRATERGAALTHQLVAYARKQPLAPMAIDLAAVLGDMTSLLRRTLGEHMEVQVVSEPGLWLAMADPAQVESALLNLALNARDAMPGGGRLTIELANKVLDAGYARQNAEVTPGEYVMLAVSDMGVGMAPDVRDRVFEPFFTTKEAGTGLGLAMVHGFARQSGGHVKVYSEPGEGTTVRLYLPRAAEAAPRPEQPEAAPAPLPRGSASVLVVEDEPAVREVTVALLRDLGYDVLEAADGAAALQLLGEAGTGIDLLLVDVVLPGGMRGDKVARRFSELRPHAPVLFMSGYTENAIIHQGRLDPGVQLISKPFSRETLTRRLAELLDVPRRTAGGVAAGLGVPDPGRH